MRKLLVLLGILSVNSINAQQSAILANYVQEGISTNYALKQQSLEIEKTLEAIQIARSNYFPKLTFNPTYTVASGGRQLEFPIGDLLNPVYNSLNQLTGSQAFPQVDNQTILFAPNNFQETKVNFQLPLFNADIKNGMLIQQKIAASGEVKKRVLTHEIAYQIEAAYLQYLQANEAIKIYQKSAVFLNDYLKFNERLVSNDMALKDVIYASELELSKLEGKRADADKNVLVAAAYFNFLLNKPYDSPILIDSLLLQMVPDLPTIAEIHASTLASRPELDQLKAGSEILDAQLQFQEKNALLPSASLGGSTGFQGFGYSFQKQAFVIAQVGLNWELFHGYEKKHKIQQTKIDQLVLESKTSETKQQLKMQATQAYLELAASEKGLQAAIKAEDSSEQLLEIVQKKYKNNAALYIEVFKAQNDSETAGLSVSLARFDLLIKEAKLRYVSGI